MGGRDGMDRWMGGWTDGWMDGWMDDGWMDAWTPRDSMDMDGGRKKKEEKLPSGKHLFSAVAQAARYHRVTCMCSQYREAQVSVRN